MTTGDDIEKIISKKVSKKLFSVVSNPEFLREGDAIRDFTYPDRVVIGTNNKKSNIRWQDVLRYQEEDEDSEDQACLICSL